MFSGPGAPRASYAGLISALQPMDPAELRFRADQLARVFTDRGVTFDLGGEERPFPLDLVPRVIDAMEWDLIVRGVRQRVRALEAFLADVYGDRQVFRDGVVPWRGLLTSSRFQREGAGLNPPHGGRGQGGAYVIETRLAMPRTSPGLFAEQRVQPVDEYPPRLLAALRAAAPAGTSDP